VRRMRTTRWRHAPRRQLRPLIDTELLAETVDALTECAQSCTASVGACLSGDQLDQLRCCLQTELGCADLCTRVAAELRRSATSAQQPDPQLLTECVAACWTCARECEAHAPQHAHCATAAEAARSAYATLRLFATVTATPSPVPSNV
jgi:hypothetical protein